MMSEERVPYRAFPLDSRETTAAGRAAFLDRFEREVDPTDVLPPEERQRRAKAAKSAYFSRLSLAALKARKGPK
jgi:hypothetical protein